MLPADPMDGILAQGPQTCGMTGARGVSHLATQAAPVASPLRPPRLFFPCSRQVFVAKPPVATILDPRRARVGRPSVPIPPPRIRLCLRLEAKHRTLDIARR